MATALDRLREMARQQGESQPLGQTRLDAIRQRLKQEDEGSGLIPSAIEAATRKGGFEAPELPSKIAVGGQEVDIGTMVSLSSGDALSSAQIVEEQLGIPVQFDPESGAPFIDIPEDSDVSLFSDVEEGPAGGVTTGPNKKLSGRFFINAPGLSPQDVADVATPVAFSALGAIPGARAASMAGRGLLTAAGEGTASLAQQSAEKLAAGKDVKLSELDQRQAAIAATLGAAGEIALPLLNRFLSTFFRSEKFVKNGEITKEGRKALEGAGINPEEVTPEFARVFGERARRSTEQSAANLTEAEALPTPVPLSRGDVSGDLEQQGFEEAAEHGAFGGEAQRIVRDFRDRQKSALRESTEQIRGQPLERGEGAQAAALAAGEVREEFSGAVNSAYADARRTAALVPRDVLMSARRRYTQVLRDRGFSPEEMPVLRGRLKKLSELTKPERTAVQMKRLEAFRQGVLQDIKSVGADTPQGAALINLKKTLDDSIEGAIDNALIIGDESALKLYRNARGLNKMMQDRFSGDAVLKKLVAPGISQRDAAQYLFGLGSLPGGKGSADAVLKLKNILGANSNEFAGLRAEAMGRIFEPALTTGPLVQGAHQFSPQKLVTAVDNFLKKEPELARALFTDSQILQMRRLRNVASKTITDARSTNPSKSGFTGARLLSQVFGNNRFTQIFMNRIIEPFIQAGGQARAAAAVSEPLIPISPLIPQGTAATAAGVASKDEQFEERAARVIPGI